MNTRASAAQALSLIVGGNRPIKSALQSVESEAIDLRNKAFVQELVYGVCRWFFVLENELLQILNKPIRNRDVDIKCLLLVGLYQLRYLDTPHHALVKETVDATTNLKKNWARKLVNATLRNAVRKNWQTISDDSLLAKLSNPAWLVSAIEKDWPLQAESILITYNKRPPLTLRVNSAQINRLDYLRILGEKNIASVKTEHSPYGVQLEQPLALKDVPGFFAGEVSVQDEAAQLAVSLLEPRANERILDACAAPGGKSGHILELIGDTGDLHVLDVDASRLKLIEENFTRLKLKANILTGDAAQPAQWWDGKLFDKILIDAPCSASGIIRRQPDVRLHRKPDDITRLAFLQLEILNALWPLLTSGGTVVYATCSIFREENDGVIRTFVAEHADCEVQKIATQWGKSTEFGRQILPGQTNMDGFFYSMLTKG